jgi:hypothetical protein
MEDDLLAFLPYAPSCCWSDLLAAPPLKSKVWRSGSASFLGLQFLAKDAATIFKSVIRLQSLIAAMGLLAIGVGRAIHRASFAQRSAWGKSRLLRFWYASGFDPVLPASRILGTFNTGAPRRMRKNPASIYRTLYGSLRPRKLSAIPGWGWKVVGYLYDAGRLQVTFAASTVVYRACLVYTRPRAPVSTIHRTILCYDTRGEPEDESTIEADCGLTRIVPTISLCFTCLRRASLPAQNRKSTT